MSDEVVVVETEATITVVGEVGPQGPQGIQGIQGIQGLKGDKGDTGDVTVAGTATVTATGTTTARSLATRFSETIHVKDFGALVDNSTDDTAALQAAIDAAYARGGGVVKIGAGTTLTSGLTLKDHVIIEGEGKNATVIKLKNSGDAHVIKTLNFEALTGTSPASGDIGVRAAGLRSLTVHGNGDNQTDATKHALAYFGIDIQLEDVALRSARGWGLWVEAPGVFYTPGGWYGYGQNSQSNIREIEVYESWTGNFYYNGQSDSTFTNVLCYRVRGAQSPFTFDTGAPHATNLWIGPKATGCRFFGTHLWGSSWYGLVNDANMVFFEQCHVESASVAKVYAKKRTNFRGHIYEVSTETAAPAILLEDGSGANFSEFDAIVSGCLLWVEFPATSPALCRFNLRGWVPSAVFYTGTPSSTTTLELSNQATSDRYIKRAGSIQASAEIIAGYSSTAYAMMVGGSLSYTLFTGTGAAHGGSLRTKGGTLSVYTDEAGTLRQFAAEHTAAADSYIAVTGGTTTAGPALFARGSGADYDLRLTPKGAGLVRFGTRTASADAPITGYIEVKDSSGTTRKLAVIS